jgi:hypothetical protein
MQYNYYNKDLDLIAEEPKPFYFHDRDSIGASIKHYAAENKTDYHDCFCVHHFSDGEDTYYGIVKWIGDEVINTIKKV